MYRIGQEEIDAVARVVNKMQLFRIGSGEDECGHFEKAWAEKMGTRYSLLLQGGTNALVAALVGLKIGPGDEVIVPSYTWIASAAAVLEVGAIPVVAEVDETLTIDPRDVEKKISAHTRAIIPVHISGFPCNMDEILRIAREHNLKVVEDSCQADGGSYKGRRLGSLGDAGAFSFNACKIISCGEGGCMVTDDPEVYERALLWHHGGCFFRTFGDEPEANVPFFVGRQCRANDIMGAILREQLKRLDGILADLRRVKGRIMKELEGVVPFRPSNDLEGDCGTTLIYAFDTEEEARAAAPVLGGGLVSDTGMHVYNNWEPILEHRGGPLDSMDPFRHPLNQGLNMEYSVDMCPRSLKLFNTTVLAGVSPEWTDADIDAYAARVRAYFGK